MRYWKDDIPFDTLEDALSSRKLDDVKTLAMLVVGTKPPRKDECITAIQKSLSGSGLQRFWERLDSLSKSAVTEVVHGGNGRFYPDRFLAKYGALPRRHHEDYHDRTKNVPWTLLDIVFTQNKMPRDIKERFLDFVPHPANPTVKTVDELPSSIPSLLHSWDIRQGKQPVEQPLHVCETEEAAFHDLVAVLRLIDSGKVGASASTHRPSLSGVKAIAGVLRDGDIVDIEKAARAEDYIRAFAWPLLVQAAGLARLKGPKLELTKQGHAALSAPAHETLKHTWNRWLDKGLIDEFNRVEAIKGQYKKGRGGLTQASYRRYAVNEALEECPAEKWIEIDEFFRYFQALGIELEVVQDPWNLYISDSQYGNLGYEGYHHWNIVQGRYVMALLMEYAMTLGLVDIACIEPEGARNDYWYNWGSDDLPCLSRYDGLKYLRITALGAYCFGISEEYVRTPLAPRSVLSILPNRDIVIRDASAFSAGDALFLDRIAVKNSDHTWALDQMRILDALESGIRPDEIYVFFDAMSHSPMPDNVRLFIDGIVQRASLVSYEGAAEVFRVADEPTALLIAHDSTARSLCYMAGPNRLVVASRHAKVFRKALRQMGFIAPQGKV